jgi:hypothetical protein
MNVWDSVPSRRTARVFEWIVVWATLVLLTNMWTIGIISVVHWYDLYVWYRICTGADHCGTRRYHQEVIRLVRRRLAAHKALLIFIFKSGALYGITSLRPLQLLVLLAKVLM